VTESTLSLSASEFAGQEFAHLVSPMEPNRFLHEYWQVQPIHIKGNPGKFRGLFDRTRFDEAIARAASLAHIPSFQVNALQPARLDEPLTLATMQTVARETVPVLLGQGFTICVNDVGAADDLLYAYTKAVKRQMNYVGRVRFNCYISPDASGADTHLDARVSTTIQIEGRKRWRFSSRPVVAWPLSNAQVDCHGAPQWMSPWAGTSEWERLEPVAEDGFLEAVLEPGDVLCLPAGTWHNAKAIGESLALNLSFSPGPFFPVLTRLLEAEFMQSAPWRGGPPPTITKDPMDDGLPTAVGEYLTERLAEVRSFLSRVDLHDPKIAAMWRDLRNS
jgi:ribosomal protein L16 Arg81 hydroxylase